MRMGRGGGRGRTHGRPSMSRHSKAKNNSWHPSTSRARQGEHAGSTWAGAQRYGRARHAKDHCPDISTRAAQTRAGMHRHVGLAAGTCTDTSTHAAQDTSAHATGTPFVGGALNCCCGSCRQVLEVASFVPGHVRNRGATPWSWTALCSKKNKVATPVHSNRMKRVRAWCPGAMSTR